MLNRITAANTEEAIQTKIINSTMKDESLNSRIFYFAQVINNVDDQNLNRVKVRIPVVDDDYYIGKTKGEGDADLPWCVPFNNRFLDVPEVNSMVMVAVFDPKVPHLGRMYFDCFTDLSNSEYFDKLTPEQKLLSNWKEVENVFNVTINGKPSNNVNAKENVNPKVGIRGKGKNKIVLDGESVSLTQNAASQNDESQIKLTKNIDVHSSNMIEVTSKKGKKRNYNPVFDDELFDYLSSTNQLLKSIVMLLNTKPAMSPNGPCTPMPDAKKLITELKSLARKFEKFKRDGSSDKILIN